DQLRLLDLVRNLRDDDDVGAATLFLDVPAGADPEAAAPGLVGGDDILARLDEDAAGRQVRARYVADQRLGTGVGRLDQVERGAAELGGVVRGDVGRHAHGDAGRAVGEQVREGAGQH